VDLRRRDTTDMLVVQPSDWLTARKFGFGIVLVFALWTLVLVMCLLEVAGGFP